MTAADTNVLVRLIIEDDPEQAARAKRLFDTTDIFIPKTVLLETEWVLRRLYGLDRETVLKSLARVLGLPNVSIEQPAVVYRAWRWAALGMDFADALHLASSGGESEFVTFDEKLHRSAQSHEAVNVRLL